MRNYVQYVSWYWCDKTSGTGREQSLFGAKQKGALIIYLPLLQTNISCHAIENSVHCTQLNVVIRSWACQTTHFVGLLILSNKYMEIKHKLWPILYPFNLSILFLIWFLLNAFFWTDMQPANHLTRQTGAWIRFRIS